MREYKGIVLIGIIILIIVMTFFIKSTYARYTSDSQAVGTIAVAKWAFETDNAINTINVNLSDTYDPTTLVDGRIAPGTRGSFAVVLNNATSETSVDFTVLIGAVANKPSNLKLYKDSSYTTEITPGTTTITGQLAKKDSTELPVTIYWKWDYYTSSAGDTTDTSDGINAANLTIPITISGLQTDPNGPEATTHID